MSGFTWYGVNRKSQLKTAKCGSGGGRYVCEKRFVI